MPDLGLGLGQAEVGITEGTSGAEVARRDRVSRRLLALADVGAAGLALILAVSVLGPDPLKLSVLAALPLLVLVCKSSGLYDRDQHVLHPATLDEAPTLFQIATLFTLAIWLGQDLFVDGPLGRDQVLGLLVSVFALTLLARTLVRRVASHELPPERCIVIGDGGIAETIRRKLERSHRVNALLVGRVPLRSGGDEYDRVPVLGSLEELGDALVHHEIERVLIAPGRAEAEKIFRVIKLVRALGVKVSVLPRLFEAVGSSVEFDEVEGLVLMGMRSYGMSKSSQMLKRGMDVVCAAGGLLLLAPMFAAVALAIKVTTRGPVLFRQRRIGRDGQEFEMLKFRTMYDGADQAKGELFYLNEADGFFKIADDPRVTPVGRLLRRSCLDELPQLINVLRGEMSIVGPRPLVPAEDRLVDGSHPRRLLLTPGITGLWQIFGSSRVPLQEMVKIDYLYGANWSLWLDVKVVLRTVPYALARRGM